jgi:hypothetical protein
MTNDQWRLASWSLKRSEVIGHSSWLLDESPVSGIVVGAGLPAMRRSVATHA